MQRILTIFILIGVVSPMKITSDIKDEDWGYVQPRKSANMFWWFYGAENASERQKLPLILWLQGGPGASGTGYGNFMEIGPVDINLKPRNTAWTKRANLLFIDNPVGAGFSYATDDSGFTTNVTGIAEDLFHVFSAFMDKYPVFSDTPFYIFCESYGGKMTSVFADRLFTGQQTGQIKSNLRGVALGDSWISATDSVLTWGPFLYQYNLLDEMDLQKVMNISKATIDAFNAGDFARSTELWGQTEEIISKTTDDVNVYNVLQHHVPSDFRSMTSGNKLMGKLRQLYNTHVGRFQHPSLTKFMNGPVKEKLGIIPENVSWGAQSAEVFQYQSEDFMKPVVNYVDKLISYGLKVVVFQGQLDMICDTPGAEAWIRKLEWSGLQMFQNSPRKALYLPGQTGNTQAFLKSYENFSLYYIMNAGHMVPADNGPMALQMVDQILSN